MFHRPAGLGGLDGRGGTAQWKSDYRADADRRAVENGCRNGDKVGIDADGGEGVFLGFHAELDHLVGGGVRFQQRMVNHVTDVDVNAGNTRSGGNPVGTHPDELVQ